MQLEYIVSLTKAVQGQCPVTALIMIFYLFTSEFQDHKDIITIQKIYEIILEISEM